jgi:hypothetical protein
MLERIRDELGRAHPEDLAVIRQYVAWVRFRGYVNNLFYVYPRAHWVNPLRAHWV